MEIVDEEETGRRGPLAAGQLPRSLSASLAAQGPASQPGSCSATSWQCAIMLMMLDWTGRHRSSGTAIRSGGTRQGMPCTVAKARAATTLSALRHVHHTSLCRPVHIACRRHQVSKWLLTKLACSMGKMTSTDCTVYFERWRRVPVRPF
jgi:hypothetical protein